MAFTKIVFVGCESPNEWFIPSTHAASLQESTVFLKLRVPASSGCSLAPSRCVLLPSHLSKSPGALGGFSSRLRSSSGCRTVGVDESGQSALQLPDRSRRTMGVSDGSGRIAPTGAVSVSDRSGSPASTTCFLSVVGGDESGQSALQLPDRSRRTTGVSDGSGRLALTGAVSVSDRSGSPAFESCRPCVDVNDESGRLAPTGAMSVSDRSGLATHRVASGFLKQASLFFGGVEWSTLMCRVSLRCS